MRLLAVRAGCVGITRLGQSAVKATIHLNAYPEWDIPGSVIAIIPTADQSKGTVKVRVAIKTKDRRILPQMAARVSFMTAPEAAATTQAARASVCPPTRCRPAVTPA